MSTLILLLIVLEDSEFFDVSDDIQFFRDARDLRFVSPTIYPIRWNFMLMKVISEPSPKWKSVEFFPVHLRQQEDRADMNEEDKAACATLPTASELQGTENEERGAEHIQVLKRPA